MPPGSPCCTKRSSRIVSFIPACWLVQLPHPPPSRKESQSNEEANADCHLYRSRLCRNWLGGISCNRSTRKASFEVRSCRPVAVSGGRKFFLVPERMECLSTKAAMAEERQL